jgi:hypothetical protein
MKNFHLRNRPIEEKIYHPPDRLYQKGGVLRFFRSEVE